MQPERPPRRATAVLAAVILLWPVLFLAVVLPEAYFLVAALFLVALAVMVASVRGLRILTSLAAGGYATFCAGLCIYRLALRHRRAPGAPLGLPDDTFHAVVLWLGRPLTTAAMVVLAAHALLYAWGVSRLARTVQVPWWVA